MSEIRPRRSVLAMPGSNARAIEKARTLPTDVVLIDLEDGTAPAAKAASRESVAAAVAARGFGARGGGVGRGGGGAGSRGPVGDAEDHRLALADQPLQHRLVDRLLGVEEAVDVRRTHLEGPCDVGDGGLLVADLVEEGVGRGQDAAARGRRALIRDRRQGIVGLHGP